MVVNSPPHCRDYLFDCLEKKEDIQNRAYGTDHLSSCIVGKESLPLFIMDLDTGKDKANILKPVQVGIQEMSNLLK